MELFTHPITIALLMSGITFATLAHVNYPEHNKTTEKKRGLLNDPKEINVLITFTVGLLSWYLAYLYNTSNGIKSNLIDPNQIHELNYASSDANLSYNIIENGIKFPNKELPPVMIEYV